jgi:nucleoside phosphorylase
LQDGRATGPERRPWKEVVLDTVLRRWILGRSRPEKIQVSTLFLSMGVRFRFRQAVAPRRPRGKFMLGRLGRLRVATLRVAPGTLQLEAALAVASKTEIKNVLAFGSVSALDPALNVGDLIIATGAVPGEGLTIYYEGPSPTRPDASLLELIRAKAHGALRAQEGVVYTTASIANLDDEFVERRVAEDLIGFDTATSALYRVSEHFGLAAVAVLVVSENPRTGEVGLAKKALMTRYERGVHRAFALLASVTEETVGPEETRPSRRRLALRRPKRARRST